MTAVQLTKHGLSCYPSSTRTRCWERAGLLRIRTETLFASANHLILIVTDSRHSVRVLSQFGISTICGSRVPEWIASRGVRDAGSRQLAMRAIRGAMLIHAHSAKTTAFLRVTLALSLPSKGADVVTTVQITQLHNVSVCRSSKHSTHKEQRQDEGRHFCRVSRPGLQQLKAYNRLRMLIWDTRTHLPVPTTYTLLLLLGAL